MASVVQAGHQSPDQVNRQVKGIVARFAQKMGIKPELAPKVAVKFTPSLSSYWTNNNTMYTAGWSQCPPPIQGFVGKWASLTGGRMGGEKLFQELFTWFLIPHEMAHFAQGRSGKLYPGMDEYASEIYANRVAIAYWQSENGSKRLEKLFAGLMAIQAKIPSPVPAGADEREFFIKHYEELGTNPNAYGWYQLNFMKIAWNERNAHNFRDLITYVE